MFTRAVQCYSKEAKPAIDHKLNKEHDKPYSVIPTPKDEAGKKGFPAVLYPSQCIKESMKSGIIDENKPLIMMFDLDEMLTTSASRTTKNIPKEKMYALDSKLPQVIKGLKQKYQKNGVPFKLVLLTNAPKDEGQVADKLEVAGFKLSDFDHSPFRKKLGDSNKKTGRAKETLLKIQDEIGGSKDDCQIMFFDDSQTHLSDVDEAVSETGMQNYHGFQTLAHLPISQIDKMKYATHQNTANGNNTEDAEIKKGWKVTEANLFRTSEILEDELGENQGWRSKVDILSYLMLTSGNEKPVNFHHSPTPPTWKF